MHNTLPGTITVAPSGEFEAAFQIDQTRTQYVFRGALTAGDPASEAFTRQAMLSFTSVDDLKSGVAQSVQGLLGPDMVMFELGDGVVMQGMLLNDIGSSGKVAGSGTWSTRPAPPDTAQDKTLGSLSGSIAVMPDGSFDANFQLDNTRTQYIFRGTLTAGLPAQDAFTNQAMMMYSSVGDLSGTQTVQGFLGPDMVMFMLANGVNMNGKLMQDITSRGKVAGSGTWTVRASAASGEVKPHSEPEKKPE